MNRRQFLDGAAKSLAVARIALAGQSSKGVLEGKLSIAASSLPGVNPQQVGFAAADWIWAPEEATPQAASQATLPPVIYNPIMPNDGPVSLLSMDQHVYFRRAFVAKTADSEATLKITAERIYQLWINGRFVGEGPALVHPRLKSYDEYSIDKYLRPGTNVVAIHGYFDGHGITVPTTPPGMLCELRVAGTVIGTDGNWQTLRPRAWSRALIPLDDQTFQEHYSFGVDPANWKDPEFDDQQWASARTLGTVGDTALPWSRPVARQIPFLTKEEIKPVAATAGEIVEWRGGGGEGNEEPAIRMSMEPVRPLNKARVNNVESLVSGNTEMPCTLLGSDLRESLDAFDGVRCPTVILDFGQLRNAHFAIDIEAAGVVWLDIGYGPDLMEGRVMPNRSTRTRWADRLELSPGRFQWRSTNWRQFRFVQLTLRRSLSPVKVRGVRAEAVRHSFRNETVFSCSDAELGKFWKAGARTADLCTTDIFMDSSRERRQYTGEEVTLPFAWLSLHGDEPLIHHYLRQISAGQLDDGFIMDCCPGSVDRRYSEGGGGFYHVLLIWEHWEQFGKREVLEEHFPHCLRHLDFWRKFSNQQGLLDFEKVRQSRDVPILYSGRAPVDQRGTNLAFNTFYYMNLRAVAAMGKVLRRPAEGLEERARTIGQVLTEAYWDEQAGLFSDTIVDGQRSALTSEFSQSLMLYAELATREQAERIVKTWQVRPEQLPWAEIGFFYFVVEGLAKSGYAAFALELLRGRLSRGLRGGREQFGEYFGEYFAGMAMTITDWARGVWTTEPSRAYAHSAGAWPPVFLLRRVAGLQLRRGIDGTLRLAPSALVPKIDVRWSGHHLAWSLAGNKFQLEANLATEGPVEVELPFLPNDIAGLTLNGIPQTLPAHQRLRLEPCRTVTLQCTLRGSKHM